MKFALSLCGGGLRGVIQSLVLAELEKQANRKCADIFSWVAGTSVGSLLTALIQARVPMSEALQFFTGDVAKHIFSPIAPFSRIKQLGSGFAYESHNLFDSLVTALGPKAGMTLDDCPNNVMIPAVDMSGHTWFFVRGGVTGKVLLADAATGSAAAPTYFNPWPVTIDGQQQKLFDGGSSGYGNPAMQLCREMFYFNGVSPAEMSVICLGTGFHKSTAPAKAPSGLLKTVAWTIDTLLDTATDEADLDAGHVCARYTKLNWEMGQDIDMADLGAVPDLIAVGTKAAASVDWNALLGASV